MVVKAEAVSPSEFWQMTPGEAGLFLEGFNERANEIDEIRKGRENKTFLSDEQRKHLEKRRAEARAKGVNVA